MRSRPRVEILDRLVTVEPGQSATANVRVRNTGNEVAQYTIDLVEGCAPRAWTQAVPAQFTLLPGDDRDVCLYFQPPLDSRTAAGVQRYGVRVSPDREEQDPSVEEADIVVGGVHALEVHVRPPHARGRRRGRYRVQFENRGTETVRAALGVDDPKEALGFAYTPSSVEVGAGQVTEVFLEVRPRAPRLTGRPTTHQFGVIWRRKAGGAGDHAVGLPVGGEIEARSDVTYEQLPLVPKAAIAAIGLLATLGAFLAFRPSDSVSLAEGNPPEPPSDFSVSPGPEGAFDVRWSQTGAQSRAAVEVRQVECTATNTLNPNAIGEPMVFPKTETGVFTPTQPVAPNEKVCFQHRSIDDAGRGSVWLPLPPVFASVVAPDNTVPAPTNVESEDLGEGSVEVRWTPPTGLPTALVLEYVLYVDNAAEGTAFSASPATLQLGPGTHDISVTSRVKDDPGRESAPAKLAQPVVVTGSADGAGGDGAESGGSGLRPYGDFWIWFGGPAPVLTTPIDTLRGLALQAKFTPDKLRLEELVIGVDVGPMPFAGFEGNEGDHIAVSLGYTRKEDAIAVCSGLESVLLDLSERGEVANCIVASSTGETVYFAGQEPAEPDQ